MWSNRRPRRVAVAIALCVLGTQASAVSDVQQAAVGDADPERLPLFTLIPDYPTVARRDRIEGEVQVCFEITRDGRTRRIAVRNSTHRIFEKPAIRAVRASTYQPLPDDAVISGIKSCRTFRFSLKPVVIETSD